MSNIEYNYEREYELLEKLRELIKDFPHTETTLKPNYNAIPVQLYQVSEENVKIFSDIWELIQNITSFNKVKRTESHGISHARAIRFPAYDVEFLTGNRKGADYTAGGEIIIGLSEGWYRIQLRPQELMKDKKGRTITGRYAFWKLVKLLEDDNIKITDYMIEDVNKAREINDSTERYIIKAENNEIFNKELENVHHIDFHSSFPAGLVNTHPEFKATIEKIYNKRHEDDIYKAILNLSIGFMHSPHIKYKYAQLSHDAINDNNKRVKAMAKLLKKSGRKILLYNTDGIWYQGDIFHGEGEGDKLGEWRNDHINCKFRAKSQGSYEFIENGKYYPVVRGATKLDRVKTREEWQWGDIY